MTLTGWLPQVHSVHVPSVTLAWARLKFATQFGTCVCNQKRWLGRWYHVYTSRVGSCPADAIAKLGDKYWLKLTTLVCAHDVAILNALLKAQVGESDLWNTCSDWKYNIKQSLLFGTNCS